MSENPLQLVCHGFGKVSECIQTNLSRFISRSDKPSSTNKNPLITLSTPNHLRQPDQILNKGKSSAPTTKEELGRATWTFLHTLAAQYPDKPTRQQKKDVKELVCLASALRDWLFVYVLFVINCLC